MKKLKILGVSILSIVAIIVIGIGIALIFSSNRILLKPLADRVEEKYTEVKWITIINIGPHCEIRYPMEPNNSFKVCESIFYDRNEAVWRCIDAYNICY